MVPESEDSKGTPAEQDTAVIQPVAEEAREGVEPAPVAAIEASAGHDIGALDFVLDVPLRVTVEIGSARMLVRDVLQLGRGSVGGQGHRTAPTGVTRELNGRSGMATPLEATTPIPPGEKGNQIDETGWPP